MIRSEVARDQMVRHQVRTRDVFDDRILAMLHALPRDLFVPRKYKDLAYADIQLPLAHAQVMMTPGMEGCLLQSLDLDATDKVLEVGTGSGFLTACLSRLTDSVLSIDIYDDLLESAERRPQISRRKIQAANARITKPFQDPSTAQATARTLTKTYSGYVHGASPQIMELYWGLPPAFHLTGMLNTPFIPSHTNDFRLCVHRGIDHVGLVAMLLGDTEVAGEIRAIRLRFEDESGLQF